MKHKSIQQKLKSRKPKPRAVTKQPKNNFYFTSIKNTLFNSPHGIIQRWNQPFCKSLPFIADKVHTTITKDQIIGAAIFIENNSSFNFSNFRNFEMGIQKDFTMSIDLFNETFKIPNHLPKINSNNCTYDKLSSNLISDQQQTLGQTLNQNQRICLLCKIEPKSLDPFQNIIDPETEKNITISKFNLDQQTQSK